MKVGTNEWLDAKISVIENICLTLEDYFRDYEHLKELNSDRLKILLQDRLAKGYITAILQKYSFLIFFHYFSKNQKNQYLFVLFSQKNATQKL
jgi:hypothetical protein